MRRIIVHWKQIPNIINQRLTKRSSNKENFLKTKNESELKIKVSDYYDKTNMKTKEQKTKKNNKNRRKRNIICNNPYQQFS